MVINSFFLCACYAHIAQSALLLKLFLRGLGHVAWEQTFLRSAQKHNGKFKTLCGMKCHKHDNVLLFVIIIHVRNKRNFFKICV